MPTMRQEHINIYWAWKAMKQRTMNERCRAYKNYGGRGIRVCAEWMEFEPFCAWALSNGWQKGRDLDRVDNDGDYEPANCRWVDRRSNVNNRRNTVHIEVGGVDKPLTEWADAIGCDRAVITLWVKTRGKEYAASRIGEALKDGYKARDFSRNHVSTPVMCTETGQSFSSISEAARTLGVNNGNVWRALKTGGAANGYHFTAA